VSVYHPTYAGVPDPWSTFSSQNTTPIDYYVIAGQAQNKSQSNQFIPFIDQQVANTLFGSGGLNIPMDPFVTRTGPMATVFLDTTKNGFDGYPANQTYSCGDSRNGIGAPPQSPYLTVTTLVGPSSAVLGEDVSLQVKVTSQAGAPTGTVSFQDGTTVLGSATLDATGAATFSASGLALGAHSLVAYYLVNDPYYASQSAAVTLTVYANSPQMTFTLSTRNLSMSSGTNSAAVGLQMVSKSGLAGTITLSCTGLPAGMTCNFSPAQPTITAGGTASSTLTVSTGSARAAMVPLSGGISGLLLLPVSVGLLWRVRKNARAIQASMCILVLSLVSLGCMVGCGGGSSKPQTPAVQQTILVNASCGELTVSVPLVINSQ